MTASTPSSDSLASPARQGLDAAPWSLIQGRGRLRLHTLIALRWRGVIGQLAVLVVAGVFAKAQIPWMWCLPLVAISAISNGLLVWMNHGQRQAQDWETAGVLAFDTVQLSLLLFFTGGIINPFALMLVAPVALAASTVRTPYVLGMVTLGFCAVAAVSIYHWPFPAPAGEIIEFPMLYRTGMTVATIAAIGFTASYAWRASMESERMELALKVTQEVLAREQQLSALGALAAAAAHELGTPLATIQIVAKELGRNTKDRQLKEDAELLVSQAERCREILKRLTDAPQTEDAMHARLTLLQLLNEVVEPHVSGAIRVEAVVTGPPGAQAPEIRRMPEVLHAMTTLVENATDFARSEVLVSARFDATAVIVEVRDDGPGFSPDVLAKLGQPYVTTRPHGEGSRSGHAGMGLGFFIAKTLLEKTGASVSFENARRGGAVVAARWLRSNIEAPPLRDFPSLGA